MSIKKEQVTLHRPAHLLIFVNIANNKIHVFSSGFTYKLPITDDISSFYVENHDFLELALGTLFSTHFFAKLHLGTAIYGRWFVLLRRDYAPLLIREFRYA